MKKSWFSVVLIMALLMIGNAFAQSWQDLTAAPGTVKKFAQQVIKERLTKADSTTGRRIISTDTTIAIKMGTLPKRSMITGVQVYVAEAFNQTHGSAKDSIAIGSYYDIDAYMSLLAVSSTGVKSGSLTSTRYVAADSVVWLYFKRQGDIMSTTGDVVVGLEYLEFPR